MNKISLKVLNIFNKKAQPEKRNRAALSVLWDLGFDRGKARKALIDLNEIRLAALANGITKPTLYATLYGTTENRKAKEILAGSLGLKIEEMFPEAVNQ